uniref:Cytochrome P450 n=1 Tax=Heterorhabditis bacteriophora TaxID=37862 RepID=A0A1I7XP90_HETBA
MLKMDLEEPISLCVANIIQDFVLGKSYSYGDSQFRKFKSLIDAVLTDVASKTVQLINAYPVLAYLPIPALKRYKENGFALQRYYEELYFLHAIQEHKECLDMDGEPRDFMEAYLREMKRQKDNPHFKYSERNSQVTPVENKCHLLKRLLLSCRELSMFYHGPFHIGNLDHSVVFEKFYLSLSNFMKYCIIYSNKLAGKKKLNESDIFRTTEDVEVMGFKLPKGTVVLPQYGTVHYDQRYYPEPDKFRPERFLDQDGYYRKRPELNLFGMGKRSCLGENLARYELFLLFTTLIQKYEFRAVEGEPLPSLKRSEGMTNVPQKYRCMVVPRRLVISVSFSIYNIRIFTIFGMTRRRTFIENNASPPTPKTSRKASFIGRVLRSHSNQQEPKKITSYFPVRKRHSEVKEKDVDCLGKRLRRGINITDVNITSPLEPYPGTSPCREPEIQDELMEIGSPVGLALSPQVAPSALGVFDQLPSHLIHMFIDRIPDMKSQKFLTIIASRLVSLSLSSHEWSRRISEYIHTNACRNRLTINVNLLNSAILRMNGSRLEKAIKQLMPVPHGTYPELEMQVRINLRTSLCALVLGGRRTSIEDSTRENAFWLSALLRSQTSVGNQGKLLMVLYAPVTVLQSGKSLLFLSSIIDWRSLCESSVVSFEDAVQRIQPLSEALYRLMQTKKVGEVLYIWSQNDIFNIIEEISSEWRSIFLSYVEIQMVFLKTKFVYSTQALLDSSFYILYNIVFLVTNIVGCMSCFFMVFSHKLLCCESIVDTPKYNLLLTSLGEAQMLQYANQLNTGAVNGIIGMGSREEVVNLTNFISLMFYEIRVFEINKRITFEYQIVKHYISCAEKDKIFTQDEVMLISEEWFVYKTCASVGKTAVITRFIDGYWVNKAIPTIGVDFTGRTVFIDGQSIRIQLWDTAGQEAST